jgi:hypothetical protein
MNDHMTVLILLTLVLTLIAYFVRSASSQAEQSVGQAHCGTNTRRRPFRFAIALLASGYALFVIWRSALGGWSALDQRLANGGLLICILCILLDLIELIQGSRAKRGNSPPNSK